MHDKPFVVAVYLLLAMLLAGMPIAAQFWRMPNFFTYNILDAAFRLLCGRKSRLAGYAGGLLLGTTLIWWRTLITSVLVGELLAYCLLAGACLWALHGECNADEDARQLSARIKRPIIAVAMLAAAAVSFSTGIIVKNLDTTIHTWHSSRLDTTLTTWHHWGAYVAPAELMRAGGRIFYDFPAQYGFGPTALIAATCGKNCWRAMYYVASVASLAFIGTGLLVACSLPFRRIRAFVVVLGAIFAAYVLWVAFPASLSFPTSAPSSSLLRFLPAIALTAVALFSERPSIFQARWKTIGFALFAIGVLYSPESLFMCCMVWVPYFCLRCLAETPAEQRGRVLIKAVLTLTAVLVAVIAAFVAVYRLWLGIFPSVSAYLLYMRYPPGPMPINPTGPIWFYGMALALGGWASLQLYRRNGNDTAFRQHYLLVLMSFASLCYALGRSHDNNFLNILPYTALVLASVMLQRINPFLRALAVGMTTSLVALCALFTWSVWLQAVTEGRLFQFNAPALSSNFSYEALANQCNTSCDAITIVRALAEIKKRSDDPVIVLDKQYLNISASSQKIWNALHGLANYVFVPAEQQHIFLHRGALRFAQSGWLLVDRSIAGWVETFKTSYVITEELDFGTFHALHFVPRS